MFDLLIRCSSIGKIMTEPKTKAEGPLSVGAKTYIRQLAAQGIFNVQFEVSSKPIEKGLEVEGESIALLNRVRGLSLQGERAVLTLNGASTSQLRAWLAEVRSGARARPVEANLTRGAEGYSGTVVVALPGEDRATVIVGANARLSGARGGGYLDGRLGDTEARGGVGATANFVG